MVMEEVLAMGGGAEPGVGEEGGEVNTFLSIPSGHAQMTSLKSKIIFPLALHGSNEEIVILTKPSELVVLASLVQ